MPPPAEPAALVDATAIVASAPEDSREMLYSFRLYRRICEGWIDADDSAAQICRKLFVCLLVVDCIPSLAWLICAAALGNGVALARSTTFSSEPLPLNGGAHTILVLTGFLTLGVANVASFMYVASLSTKAAAAAGVSSLSSSLLLSASGKRDKRAPSALFIVPALAFDIVVVMQLVLSAMHGWAIGFDVGANIMMVRIAGVCCAATLGRAKRLGVSLVTAALLIGGSVGHVGSALMRRSLLESLWPYAIAHAIVLLLLFALLVRDVWLVQRWPTIVVADQTSVLEQAMRCLVTSSAAMADVGGGLSLSSSSAATKELVEFMTKASGEFYTLVDRLEDIQLACSLLLLRSQLVEASALNRTSAIATTALKQMQQQLNAGNDDDEQCRLGGRRASDAVNRPLSRRSSIAAADRLTTRRSFTEGNSALALSSPSTADGSSSQTFARANSMRRRSSAQLHNRSRRASSSGDMRNSGSLGGGGGGGRNERTACILVLHSANARRAVSEAAEMEQLLQSIVQQNGGFLHQGSTTLRAVVSWNAVAEQQYMFENHVTNAVLSLKHRCRNFFFGVAMTGQVIAPCSRTVSIISDNWTESRLLADLLRQGEAHNTIFIDFATAVASFDFQLDLVDIFSRDLQASLIGASPEHLRAHSRRLSPLFAVVREARGDTNEQAVHAARFAVQGKWEDLNYLLQNLAEAMQAGEHGRRNDVLDADDDIVQLLDEMVQVNLAAQQQQQQSLPYALSGVPFVEVEDD